MSESVDLKNASILFFLRIVNNTKCREKLTTNKPYEDDNTFFIFLLVIAGLNLVLNGLCVQIFRHPLWKNSAMSSLLKGLSLIEVFFGLSTLLHIVYYFIDITIIFDLNKQVLDGIKEMPSEIYTEAVKGRMYSTVVQCFLQWQMAFWQISRNWSVVLMAAYRYDVVCRPLNHVTLFQQHRVKYMHLLVILLSSIFTLPRAFERNYYICWPAGNIYEPGSKEDDSMKLKSLYHLCYNAIAYFLVQILGPVFCVSVLSFFVIRAIAKRRHFHKNRKQQTLPMRGNAPQKPEKLRPGGDKLVLALCFTFFLMEMPSFFSKIIQSLDDYNVFGKFANVMIYFDSTMNVIVYMLSNPTFRIVFMKIYGPYFKWCKCICGEEQLVELEQDPDKECKAVDTITRIDVAMEGKVLKHRNEMRRKSRDPSRENDASQDIINSHKQVDDIDQFANNIHE
ncbi:hypothetical protein Ciccas_006946 [Cichlidogyrus casuarinus]|uniref:G-protein coupled receptors family 1 profile domain-containing protein n=1 Tax=Cichlidogyrus casuarinus TaxID=1844966 RepID=A0ABD2Q4A3_9PLAT